MQIKAIATAFAIICSVAAGPIFEKRDVDSTAIPDNTSSDNTATSTVITINNSAAATSALATSAAATSAAATSALATSAAATSAAATSAVATSAPTTGPSGNATVDNNDSKYNSSNIQLVSDDSFCSFLPHDPGVDIATTEGQGKPFCTDSSLGGYKFPEGLIKTAHFVKTENYTQVTGTMDPTAYNMSTSDDGGQYDNRDQERHTCNDLKYFVNLIEPNGGTFCIRCCVSKEDCNIGISQKGCRKIIPGDYS